MPEDFLNFVMGGALCALGGVIGFLVRKRWPNNHVVTVLSWVGFFAAFGGAVFFFGS